MKYKILLFVIVFPCINHIYGQNFLVGIYSGYSRTELSLENYSTTGSSPLGFRIAGGSEKIQLGAEYVFGLVNKSFQFKDPFDSTPRFREEFKDSYAGLLVRLNSSAEPKYNVGFIMEVGAGYLFGNKNIILESGKVYESTPLKKSLSYNGGMGLSVPIIKGSVQMNILGNISYSNREMAEKKFNALSYGLNLGVFYTY